MHKGLLNTSSYEILKFERLILLEKWQKSVVYDDISALKIQRKVSVSWESMNN